MATYVQQQPMGPTATTTTYTQTPFGMQQQTTYGAPPMAPAPMTTTTQYGPFGTTVTQTAAPVSRAIVCAQCRATFTTAVSSPVVSCPYCFFVNQSGAPVTTTVSYAAPAPPPMATTTVSYGAPVFY